MDKQRKEKKYLGMGRVVQQKQKVRSKKTLGEGDSEGGKKQKKVKRWESKNKSISGTLGFAIIECQD